MKKDVYYLKQAIKMGNTNDPPYNFGAVVVQDGNIIAADHNHVHADNDPSAHAEIRTIVKACKLKKTHNLDNCTLYCSHEPCLMCVNCAAWAHIRRIVYSHPAKDNKDFVYHFEGLPIEEFVKRLPRPLQLDYIKV